MEDADRPLAHVAPRHGWLNDPNGPVWFRGRWHLFYQHVPQGCEWQWGLVWGHAVSKDLAHWRHLPPALVPTAGGLDADGCWSGCCAVSAEGVPTILYTGVRLRSNRSAGPPPPPDQDLGLLWIESQLAAVPEDPDDDLLLRWHKLEQPAVALPPSGVNLTGWRDPFVFLGARSAASGAEAEQQEAQWTVQSQAQQQGYRMLLGSGIKGSGGALLVYSSTSAGYGDDGHRSANSWGSSLAHGWQCQGQLCSIADLAAAAADVGLRAAHELGEVWECPLLVQLPAADAAGSNGITGGGGLPDGQPWLLAVSPYPVKPPYSTSNPVLYWIGSLDAGSTRFDACSASGPFRLDHGDVLYAPNVCTDAQGRLLLWAWLQERRAPGTAATYAGCLTLPRMLSQSPDGRRLVQQPAPELALLRRCLCSHCSEGEVDDDGRASCAAATAHTGFSSRGGWCACDVEVTEEQVLPIEGVWGPQLDIELTFSRGSAAAVGVLLLSYEAGRQGNALLTYTWQTNALEVQFGAPAPQQAVPADTSGSCSRGEASESLLGSGPAGATRWHLPVPPTASSPRKKQQHGAVATVFAAGTAPGSPAAAAVAAAAAAVPELLLAELAEPLPEAAAVEAVVAKEAAAASGRRLGGPLSAPAVDASCTVQLRLMLDGSAMEVFTGSGEVLSTRVYRGTPPAGSSIAAAGPAAGSGVCVVALGGTAVLDSGAAWELSSRWEEEDEAAGQEAGAR